jgi:O-antigen ligase
MLAQDILLGRPRARVQSIEVGLVDRGAAPRSLLTVLIVLVLAFESSTADPTFAAATYIYKGLASWTPIPVLLTPLELLLILAVMVSLVMPALGTATPARPLRWPMAAFAAALVFGFFRGFLGSGDMYVGLWEIRSLLYIPACFLIARASITRPGHVAWILWAGLLGVVAFALEGAYRKVILINSGALAVVPEFFYEHEDVVFLAAFLALVVCSFYFRVQTRLRTVGLITAPVIAFTLLASNRRAGIIVMLVALLALGLIVFTERRKAFFASVVPALVLGVLYVALFWNATGVIAQPARAIRSLYEPDPRDASSNLYRVLETYNLNLTIHEDPLLGVGFGREFKMVAKLADLSWWPFWRFEPHNNILWIWLKTGAIGYAAFWLLFGSAICRAAIATRRLADPALRTVALFCLLSLAIVLVFSYVDLGLVSVRVAVFVGTVLGLVSVLPAVDRARPVGGKEETWKPVSPLLSPQATKVS